MNVIQIENLVKTFRLPHKKIDSIREGFVNLFKRFDYEVFNALQNLSFEVKQGEFFGIIGRNGGGKSTLLKILTKIYSPTSGFVKITGKISPFLELGVGFNPELSGRDNVFLGGTLLGMRNKEIDEKYDEIVSFSGLERFMDQKVKNYSSGMHSRLAFALASQVNSDIFVFDEVLAVGDATFSVKCFDRFNVLKKSNKTIIFVSHDLDSVRKYCDRTLYLRNGEIAFLGNTEAAIKAYSGERFD